MKKIAKPDIIFFDWDGTIIETSDFIECLSKTLFKNYPLDGHGNVNDFKKVIKMAFSGGIAAKDAIHYLYDKTDYNLEDILKFMINGGKDFSPKLFIRDGIIDVLRAIKKKNIDMCIVSNRDGISLVREVEELELLQYFKKIVSFDTVDKPKPAPDIIYYATKLMKKENVLLSNCWLVGDTMSDIGCAINSGVIPFFVGPKEEMTEECIHHIKNKTVIKIDKYSELGDIIDLLK